MEKAYNFWKQLGFHPVPLIANDRIPICSGWRDKEFSLATFDFNNNIGLKTGGAFGLVVIDIDVKNGKDGEISWRELLWENKKKEPETIIVSTPSGGRHLYFRTTESYSCGTDKLGVGIDIRGDGGVLPAPPSSTDKGQYKIISKFEPCELPEWLSKEIGKRTAVRKSYTTSDFKMSEKTTPYGAKAIKNVTEDLRNSSSGSRNEALNNAAFSVGQLIAGGEICKSDIKVLMNVGREIGLEDIEIRATVKSGIAGGMECPRSSKDAVVTEWVIDDEHSWMNNIPDVINWD